jgi:hypothetical protein
LAFPAFWEAYPRKVAKQNAEKAWRKGECEAIASEIMAALAWQAPLFAKRDPEHVPHAATWLNGRRWTDPRPGAPRAPTNGVAKGPLPPPPPGSHRRREPIGGAR